MKYLAIIAAFLMAVSCNNATENAGSSSTSEAVEQPLAGGGQSAVVDNESGKDIVKVASGSKDHSTLVAALKAADYVNAISNAGPFTVFAPTNAAFDALPKGTVDDLLKPENKDKLRSILEYHVYLGVLKDALLSDGVSYGMASGQNVTIGNKDGKVTVNGANIIASIPATNGIIHVVDKVLLPETK
ncbi:MAG TPA: fasciclin domain-containing protein [Ferruginibacter sp.]|nr:fasciclin domain-containing protein [Ferruginibacter sp.]HRE63751.1 fasciclin domain-containing protein [Ferruginibacter sp.]